MRSCVGPPSTTAAPWTPCVRRVGRSTTSCSPTSGPPTTPTCTSTAPTPSTSTAYSPSSTPTGTAHCGGPALDPAECHSRAGTVSYAEPQTDTRPSARSSAAGRPAESHIGGTNLFSVSPGYTLHSGSGDQRHPRRLRALLAGLARPDRTTATPARARRLQGPDLPRPRTHRHHPRPAGSRSGPGRGPIRGHLRGAETRPTGQVGPGRADDRRRPRRTRDQTVAGRADLRPDRPDGQDVLQHPGHLRRVRGRPAPDAHPRRHGRRSGQRSTEGPTTQTDTEAADRTAPHARHRRLLRHRPGRTVQRVPTDRVSNPGAIWRRRHLEARIRRLRTLTPRSECWFVAIIFAASSQPVAMRSNRRSWANVDHRRHSCGRPRAASVVCS